VDANHDSLTLKLKGVSSMTQSTLPEQQPVLTATAYGLLLERGCTTTTTTHAPAGETGAPPDGARAANPAPLSEKDAVMIPHSPPDYRPHRPIRRLDGWLYTYHACPECALPTRLCSCA